jgi:[ribosomal protein S18]-alanine N-acetyltransferase
MNTVSRPIEAAFEPLSQEWVEAVLAVEVQAYEFPWTRGNFMDSLQSGYEAQLLLGGQELIGYFVAMKGVDEVHLLNITVAPAHQRQGWARLMLDALATWSRGQGSRWLWLEVRMSNVRARAIYEKAGFRPVGLRRGYYPAAEGRREDGIVMGLPLS